MMTLLLLQNEAMAFKVQMESKGEQHDTAASTVKMVVL